MSNLNLKGIWIPIEVLTNNKIYGIIRELLIINYSYVRNKNLDNNIKD